MISYYSDVAIVIRQSDKDRFLHEITKFDEYFKENIRATGYGFTTKEVYNLATTYDNVVSINKDVVLINKDNDERYFVVSWSRVKWWESCFFGYRFFENLNLMFYRDYVRVGEDPGDIEEDYQLNTGIISPYIEQRIQIHNLFYE